MSVSITSDSTTITIDGAHKEFVGDSGSTTTVIKRKSGDAITGQGGRFLLWKATVGDTKTWEIRYIESATSTEITVGDGGFKSAPPEDAEFAISTNLADIESAVPTACTSSGLNYSFNGRQWNITGGAFLADIDKSLEMEASGTTGLPTRYELGSNCAIQFGRLLGGEANGSFETTQGCRIRFRNNSGSMSLLSSTYSSSKPTHPVTNFYGCLIESSGNQMFMRAGGPCRIIGCIVDGTMGGRWVNEATELVQSRFSGNRDGGVSWSLGTTFARPIESCSFYDNLFACKSYQSYSGEFRDTTFTDTNTDILHSSQASGSSPGTFKFIDCTTFGADKLPHSRTNVEQLKSINYNVTDSDGTGLDDVLVGVYDKDGTLQTGVQTSASGAVGQILAKFFIRPHKGTDPAQAVEDKTPFDIRIRKYGFTYLGFQSSVSEPIKQEVRLVENSELVSNKTQAQVISGISINFGSSTLTLTEDHSAQALYDYYQYQLGESANMQYAEDFTKSGSSFDLGDWDLVVDGCTYTGDITTSGTITRSNDGKIIGTATDSSGTVVLLPWEIKNVEGTSRIQLWNVSDGKLIHTAKLSEGSGFYDVTGTYDDTQIASGDLVRLRVTCVVGTEAMLPVELNGVATATGITFQIEQKDDEVYNANAINGSELSKTLHATTGTLSADFVSPIGIDINDADGKVSAKEVYAFYTYTTTTSDGVHSWFGAINAIDTENYEIKVGAADIKLQNVGSVPVIVYGGRLFRDDGTSVLHGENGDLPISMDTGMLALNVKLQVDQSIDNNEMLNSTNNNTKLIPGIL